MVRTGVVYVTPPALVPPNLDSTSAYRTDVGSFHRTDRRIRLTIRLSDAGLRQRQTELLNPNHRPSPWPTEDAGSRARSSRLLGANTASYRRALRSAQLRAYSSDAWLGKNQLPFPDM